MATAYIDVAKGANFDEIATTAASGGTVTGALRVAWDDTLTRQEIVELLQNISDAVLTPAKVSEVSN